MSDSIPTEQEQSPRADEETKASSSAKFKSPGLKPRRLSNLPKRGLETDRFSVRIPADFDAAHTAAETHGHDHWKVKALHFLHTPTVQWTLMVLLLLDVLILFMELFLQAEFPNCSIIERDGISCCPSNTTTTGYEDASAHTSGFTFTSNVSRNTSNEEHHFLRFLSEASHGDDEQGDDHHESICEDPSLVESYDYAVGCDGHKWHVVHTVEQVMFAFTVTILSIFFIELIVMMLALQKAFFRQFFYVLDLVIVTVSLVLEVALKIANEDLLVALTGLIIFARAWRFVRIGHGLIEVTAEYQAKDKEALLEYAAELEEKLEENNIDLPEKSRHVKRIEKHMSHHSSDDVSNKHAHCTTHGEEDQATWGKS